MTTKPTNRKPSATAKRRGAAPNARSRRTSATKTATLSPFDAARYLDSYEAAAEFVDAALETGEPEVLIRALGEVARARGMTHAAKRSGLGRESLYKVFQPSSHPRLETIMRVARALEIRLYASAA